MAGSRTDPTQGSAAPRVFLTPVKPWAEMTRDEQAAFAEQLRQKLLAAQPAHATAR